MTCDDGMKGHEVARTMERCRDDDNGDGTVATGPGTTGTSGTTGRRAQRGATRRVGHADAEGQDWPTGDDRSYGDAQWREGTAALATGAVRRPAATGTKGTQDYGAEQGGDRRAGSGARHGEEILGAAPRRRGRQGRPRR